MDGLMVLSLPAIKDQRHPHFNVTRCGRSLFCPIMSRYNPNRMLFLPPAAPLVAPHQQPGAPGGLTAS